MSVSLPTVAVAIAMVALVSSAALGAGCSKPSARHGAEADTEGGEQVVCETRARETPQTADIRTPGSWAPRHSLARIERVARAGTVQTRGSLSGTDRVVLIVPVTDDGNTLFEAFGMPGRDGQALAVGVRAAHEPARWTTCSALAIRAGESALAIGEARPDAVPSPLGMIETVQARTTLDAIIALGDPDVLSVEVCGERIEVRGVAGHLAELARLFSAGARDAGIQTTSAPATDAPVGVDADASAADTD